MSELRVSVIEDGVTWQLTPALRWLERPVEGRTPRLNMHKYEKVLQQKQIGPDNKSRWVDIPTSYL